MLTKYLKLFVLVGTGICASSCVTNPDVVFVDTDGQLVRLGRDVRGHVYYWKDGGWVRSQNKVTLPAGWYAGGLPPDMRPDAGSEDNAP
jgi:hypothetical protein